MDGHSLLRMLREQLQETTSGTFMNDRTSYDNLYAAVQDFNFRTHYITGTQTISVTAATSEYNLNPDFVELALMDSSNRKFIKHTYGTSSTFVYPRDYASVILENNSSTANIASSFYITDADKPANMTGSATSIGAASNGEATLTDTGATFTTLAAGDYVHNTTQSTDGVIMAVTSATQVVTAMFNDGVSGSAWAQNDAYVITRQPRWKIGLYPIPADTATVTVYYVKRPDPVYSVYRSYKFPFNYQLPIVQFAAFLYKYRDREPNYGDSLFQYYDAFVRRVAAEMRRGTGEKQGIRVNFSKIAGRSKTIGNYSR